MIKLDILAIGVHPDDIELCASGTLLRHIDMGYQVGILDLTQGELGTRGTPETRLEEAYKSAQIGGIQMRANVGLADGFFTHNSRNARAIIPYIRMYQPELVLINARWDRHPDHARASRLAQDACFLSGLRRIQSVDPVDGLKQKSWRPRTVYQYIQDYNSTPDMVVDISEFFEKKMEMIKAFASQFYNPGSNEPESPISSKNFLDNIDAQDRVMGRFIGVTHGEGFHKLRPIGVPDLLKLT
jgi:bacillithiol biosynthesis deacetylase BshB1